ncbi:MAG: ABC transporter permease [Candidatus Brocadiia bacterium]
MATQQDKRGERITVRRPNQRHELGWFRTWAVMVNNVVESRDLIWQLFKRDFLAQYKKSFIGFTWIFFAPVMGIVSWLFLKEAQVLKPGDVGAPFPLYVLLGSSLWGLFMGFYHGSRDTLSSGKQLVMKVNYPHEALLFKQAAQRVAQFSLTFCVLMVAMLAYRQPLHWQILVLPLALLPMFLFASAIGLVLSMTSIVAVDFTRVFNRGMSFLMYLTPVIYAPNAIEVENPTLRSVVAHVLKINPLTYLVGCPRNLLLHGTLNDPTGFYEPWSFFIWSAGALVLFLISWRLFFVSEHMIVERML